MRTAFTLFFQSYVALLRVLVLSDTKLPGPPCNRIVVNYEACQKYDFASQRPLGTCWLTVK